MKQKRNPESPHFERIIVTPAPSFPDIEMKIEIPKGWDAEKYIDELLDSLLEENLRYNCEWIFV